VRIGVICVLNGMNSLATNQIEIRATSVRVSDDALVVDLSDGRTVLTPLAWYPRLLHGTAAERNDHQLIGEGLGIHWPQLDEDISVEGILAGRKSYESKESFDQWLASRPRAA
jgi:Protein of unknown function (DUF2442)